MISITLTQLILTLIKRYEVYWNKERKNSPPYSNNHVSDIQILQRKCVVVSEKVFLNEPQVECFVIAVFISLGAEVLVAVAGHVLLEEASQVLQVFFLILLEVAAHDDDAPVGKVAHAVAILPEADVAV